MALSKKCYYAIRSIFELTKHSEQGRPLKIGDIARAQDIPVRFLEAILNELKAGGFVESRRGAEGGYLLAPNQEALTIGHIVEFIEGPLAPVECIMGKHQKECNLSGQCVYLPIWKQIHQTISDAYYRMEFRQLVEQGRRHHESTGPCDYSI